MFYRTQVLWAALLLGLWLPWSGNGRAQGNPAQAPPGPWRSAPEYVRLFAPTAERRSAYRAYVSSADLQIVLRQLEAESSLLRPPGAWIPAALLPLDAFGKTGTYDPWKMARLFGARRAMVARGPRGEGGRPVEAWTLISPYPDRDLEYLEPGTLLLVLDLAR
jgi:hypothetical protein